jgi:hypothetical protein
VHKTRIDEAKRAVCDCLDLCPVDVIQQFFNCSWRFMSAYWQGLTGKAAEWAVHKQSSHWRVGVRLACALALELGSMHGFASHPEP